MRNDHKQDDVAQFRRAMAGVKRLRSDRVHHAPPRPRAYPAQTLQDEARVMEELNAQPFDAPYVADDDTLSYCRPGVQKSVLRKLKRGQYRIAAELDLHGLTVTEAYRALGGFLQDMRKKRLRCVRIIHGKGHQSSNRGPVLKPMVNQCLRRRDDVLAFCPARPVDGGSGAIYVLLRAI